MRQAALQAVAFDPELAEAHTVLGGYLHVYEWNWEAAEREYIRAIELDPNYHTARLWYGYFLEAMGRFDESLVQRRRMVELDPLMPSVGLGTVLNLMGRGEEALEFYRDVIERDSAYWQADEAMSDVYEGGGKLDEAARALERAVAHAGNTSRPKAHLARVLARAGNRVEARRLLEELRAQARASDIYHPVVATALAAAGDVDGAFAWLEKSYAQRHPDLNHLSVEGAYRALRGDPRFTDLLRRVGLRGS